MTETQSDRQDGEGLPRCNRCPPSTVRDDSRCLDCPRRGTRDAAEGAGEVRRWNDATKQYGWTVATPQPAPDAVRKALRHELRISSPHDYREWISIVAALERVFAAPVPSPEATEPDATP